MLLTQSWHKALFATIASPETQASSVPDNLSPRSHTPSLWYFSVSLSCASGEREIPLGWGVGLWRDRKSSPELALVP